MSQSGYSKSSGQTLRSRQSAQRDSLNTNISSLFPAHLDVETIIQLCRPPCIDMLNQFYTYTDEHIRELLAAPPPPAPALQQASYHTPDSSGYFPRQREQMDSHLPTSNSTSATPTPTIISPPTTDWPIQPSSSDMWSMNTRLNPAFNAPRQMLSSTYHGSATSHEFTSASMAYFPDPASAQQSLQTLQTSGAEFRRQSGILDQDVHNLWPVEEISYSNIIPTSLPYIEQAPTNPVRQPVRQQKPTVPSTLPRKTPEWPSFIVNPKPSSSKSHGTKTKVPCPELDCDKLYTSLPELREHCGAAHDKTRLSTCKHNNCGFRGYRDSIWRHHHTTDHKSCQCKTKPEETCMDWAQIWQKQNWGCNVCSTAVFESAHDWVTHYANHFQHQGKVDKDRSFSNLISSLLSQNATAVFWQKHKAQQSEPMEWPESAQQCQRLRRVLEEGLHNGRSLSQPDVASMIVALAVKLARELPSEASSVKRRATSTPAGSDSSGDQRSRRSFQAPERG